MTPVALHATTNFRSSESVGSPLLLKRHLFNRADRETQEKNNRSHNWTQIAGVYETCDFVYDLTGLTGTELLNCFFNQSRVCFELGKELRLYVGDFILALRPLQAL
jgi:hypothetical protein